MTRSYLHLLPPRLHSVPRAEEFAAELAEWVHESIDGKPPYQRDTIPPQSQWEAVASEIGREQREKITGVGHCYKVIDSSGRIVAVCLSYPVACFVADAYHPYKAIAQVRPSPMPQRLAK